MSNRFYIENMAAGQPVELEGTEAHHLTRVMRLAPGDTVVVFDGQGHEAVATIDSTSKKRAVLHVGEIKSVSRECDCKIVVGTALPKGDRLRFLTEKLTEIGVARLVPVTFQRSAVVARSNTVEKMRRHVIEASKQCGRNQLMRIGPPTPLAEFLADQHDQPRFYGSLAADLLLSDVKFSQAAHFCIGPEGGMTEEECSMAEQSQWQPVSLGDRVLRIETAAIVSAITAVTISNR